MSSETPAAHLARLKVIYQGWRISRDGNRIGAVERETGRRVTASSPGGLDARLAEMQR